MLKLFFVNVVWVTSIGNLKHENLNSEKLEPLLPSSLRIMFIKNNKHHNVGKTKRTGNYTIPLSTCKALLLFKTQFSLLLFWTAYLKPEN